jgi:hypothetical protein
MYNSLARTLPQFSFTSMIIVSMPFDVGNAKYTSRAYTSPKIIVLMMLAEGAHTNFLAPV